MTHCLFLLLILYKITSGSSDSAEEDAFVSVSNHCTSCVEFYCRGDGELSTNLCSAECASNNVTHAVSVADLVDGSIQDSLNAVCWYGGYCCTWKENETGIYDRQVGELDAYTLVGKVMQPLGGPVDGYTWAPAQAAYIDALIEGFLGYYGSNGNKGSSSDENSEDEISQGWSTQPLNNCQNCIVKNLTNNMDINCNTPLGAVCSGPIFETGMKTYYEDRSVPETFAFSSDLVCYGDDCCGEYKTYSSIKGSTMAHRAIICGAQPFQHYPHLSPPWPLFWVPVFAVDNIINANNIEYDDSSESSDNMGAQSVFEHVLNDDLETLLSNSKFNNVADKVYRTNGISAASNGDHRLSDDCATCIQAACADPENYLCDPAEQCSEYDEFNSNILGNDIDCYDCYCCVNGGSPNATYVESDPESLIGEIIEIFADPMDGQLWTLMQEDFIHALIQTFPDNGVSESSDDSDENLGEWSTIPLNDCQECIYDASCDPASSSDCSGSRNEFQTYAAVSNPTTLEKFYFQGNVLCYGEDCCTQDIITVDGNAGESKMYAFLVMCGKYSSEIQEESSRLIQLFVEGSITNKGSIDSDSDEDITAAAVLSEDESRTIKFDGVFNEKQTENQNVRYVISLTKETQQTVYALCLLSGICLIICAVMSYKSNKSEYVSR